MAEKRKWSDKFKLAMGELENKIQREHRGGLRAPGIRKKKWRHGMPRDSGREGVGNTAAP